jgi:hypothetical protein
LLPTPQRQWTTCSMGSHGKTKGSSRASLVRWGAPGEPTRGSNIWRRLTGRHERRPQRHPTQVPDPGRPRPGQSRAGPEPTVTAGSNYGGRRKRAGEGANRAGTSRGGWRAVDPDPMPETGGGAALPEGRRGRRETPSTSGRAWPGQTEMPRLRHPRGCPIFSRTLPSAGARWERGEGGGGDSAVQVAPCRPSGGRRGCVWSSQRKGKKF